MNKTDNSQEPVLVGYQLQRLSQKWDKAMKLALKPMALQKGACLLLAGLHEMEKSTSILLPITQTMLAAHVGMDVMDTSKWLRLLEQARMVERKEHPYDTRAKSLALTQDGLKAMHRALAAMQAADREFTKTHAEAISALAAKA